MNGTITLPALLLISSGTLLAGIALGVLLTLAAARRAGGGKGTADLKRELDAYKERVAAHYTETARRIDALTHAYKDAYDHLEQGAYDLVGETELRARLADAPPSTVTLEGIGAPKRLGRAPEPTSRPKTATPLTDSSLAFSHPHPTQAAPSTPAVGAATLTEAGVHASNLPDAWSGEADAATTSGTAATSDDAAQEVTPANPHGADSDASRDAPAPPTPDTDDESTTPRAAHPNP